MSHPPENIHLGFRVSALSLNNVSGIPARKDIESCVIPSAYRMSTRMDIIVPGTEPEIARIVTGSRLITAAESMWLSIT